MIRTTLTDPCAEKKTALLFATITGLGGVVALPQADEVLTSLTLTLFLDRVGTIINSRDRQSVLNVNGGAVYGSLQTDPETGVIYNLRLRLDPLDMIIVSGRSGEQHVAFIEWAWGSPLNEGGHEIAFTVTNLLKVI